MAKATNRQINYLNNLINENYSIISKPSSKVVGDLLNQMNYQSISDLEKGQASILINLLSGASKYDGLVKNIPKSDDLSD